MASSKILVVLFVLLASALGATITKVEPKGVIIGAKDCGGSGLFFEMEAETCTQSPCEFKVETNYDMAITFAAGESTNNVKWQIWLYYPFGGVSLVSESAVSGSLIEGNTYRISGPVSIASRFAGRTGEVAIMIINENNNNRLMCGEFPVVLAP